MMENKSFGWNRMGICHGGSQGQTRSAGVLKKKITGSFCGCEFWFSVL